MQTILSALAEPNRLKIVELLRDGPRSVGEIVERLGLPQPQVSKHLRVLELAGLVSRGRDGQRRPCRIEAEPLAAANAWIETYRRIWEANYARLDDLLEVMKREQRNTRTAKRTRRKRK